MHDRYQRQRALSAIGEAGQNRLRAAHAVVVGIGALGCVTADHLARAGVGRLTLIDRDIVDRTNLHRQSLYTEADADAGTPKAVAAHARLTAANSDIHIHPAIADITAARAESILFPTDAPPPDAIIDGTDNFDTRYILNDLSVKRTVPLIYAGVVGTRGTLAALIPGRTPCLRCLATDPPAPGTVETCDTAGVLGPAVGAIASLQAAEAIKILSGHLDAIRASMLEIDAWSGLIRTIDLAGLRDPVCPCCARREFAFLRPTATDGATVLCGRTTVQITPRNGTPIDLPALAARMHAAGAPTRCAPQFLRASLDAERRESPDAPITLTVFADGRALISGVSTTQRARSLYARYVGL
jgi:adenylyltransferase/sulfurtransferase